MPWGYCTGPWWAQGGRAPRRGRGFGRGRGGYGWDTVHGGPMTQIIFHMTKKPKKLSESTGELAQTCSGSYPATSARPGRDGITFRH